MDTLISKFGIGCAKVAIWIIMGVTAVGSAGVAQANDPVHRDANVTVAKGSDNGESAVASELNLGLADGSIDVRFTDNAPCNRDGIGQAVVREIPQLVLTQPASPWIFQRDDANQADVIVQGTFTNPSTTPIEARAIPRPNSNGPPSGTATGWQVIDPSPGVASFSGSLPVAGGWYDIEVRAFDGTTVLGEGDVECIGIGEVFVTAGQSNSASHGNDGVDDELQIIPNPQSPMDDRVYAYDADLSQWVVADDPQPNASYNPGNSGSPWPHFGDLVAAKFDVPVGLYSVGDGGTSVAQWQPGGTRYERLETAVRSFGPDGFRSVLWHQGESDNNTATMTYATRLHNIIDRSRTDAGWDEMPWGVALASYRSPSFSDSGINQNVIIGQWQVINCDPNTDVNCNPNTYVGAATDDMVDFCRSDADFGGIHFNTSGLKEHARRWLEAILNAGVIESTNVLADLVGDDDDFGDEDYDGLYAYAEDCPDLPTRSERVEEVLAFIEADIGQTAGVNLDHRDESGYFTVNRPVGLTHSFFLPDTALITSASVKLKLRGEELFGNDVILYNKSESLSETDPDCNLDPPDPAVCQGADRLPFLPFIALRDLNQGIEPWPGEILDLEINLGRVPVVVNCPPEDCRPGGTLPVAQEFRNLLPILFDKQPILFDNQPILFDNQLDLIFIDDTTVDYSELSITYVYPTAPEGDLTGDDIVDRRDLDIIIGALGTHSYGTDDLDDPRDLDGDGEITVLDARRAVVLCWENDRPSCVVQD